MYNIQISIRSEKKAVVEFLEDLNKILDDEGFDMDKHLIIIKTKKKVAKERFSTPYTLLDLDYDAVDIVDRLKELTVSDYSETLFDRDDDNPPLLFVFGKDINGQLVYIKLKIKGVDSKWILCLSFHYAEKKMEFPYA